MLNTLIIVFWNWKLIGCFFYRIFLVVICLLVFFKSKCSTYLIMILLCIYKLIYLLLSHQLCYWIWSFVRMFNLKWWKDYHVIKQGFKTRIVSQLEVIFFIIIIKRIENHIGQSTKLLTLLCIFMWSHFNAMLSWEVVLND
jgi:hypothetical protein